MRYTPRPYQYDMKRGIINAWVEGARVVMATLATGGGKTVTFSDIVYDHKGASCVIAHRQELVSQISLALARDGIRHRIIGPSSVVKLCVKIHMQELGLSYYDPAALCAVAGIDTLIRRGEALKSWCDTVTLWVLDEGHHLLAGNKWGIGVELFPRAKGLTVTATACRADGKGLGRAYDGIVDALIKGPSGRALINTGYLTDYKAFAPRTEIDISSVPISSSTGDFNHNKLVIATRKSKIVGDVVGEYLKVTPGKLGITFATDVETAHDIADQFNASGVPAAALSAKTPDPERIATIQKFKNRELLQLVNVDLFGEGFDLPALEVVSFARVTDSFSLYCQQFGRALRLMIAPELMARWDTFTITERLAHIAASVKPFAYIIDHVGNIERHAVKWGLPDDDHDWTLARRDRSSKQDGKEVLSLRTCLNPPCNAFVYNRLLPACPLCGLAPAPAVRSGPEHVDGDLFELDAAALSALRKKVDEVDKDPEVYRAELAAKWTPLLWQNANVKRHVERQTAQESLRGSIAWWAGYQRALGRSDSESYKRFYLQYGIDVLSAKALGTREATELMDNINKGDWH